MPCVRPSWRPCSRRAGERLGRVSWSGIRTFTCSTAAGARSLDVLVGRGRRGAPLGWSSSAAGHGIPRANLPAASAPPAARAWHSRGARAGRGSPAQARSTGTAGSSACWFRARSRCSAGGPPRACGCAQVPRENQRAVADVAVHVHQVVRVAEPGARRGTASPASAPARRRAGRLRAQGRVFVSSTAVISEGGTC